MHESGYFFPIPSGKFVMEISSIIRNERMACNGNFKEHFKESKVCQENFMGNYGILGNYCDIWLSQIIYQWKSWVILEYLGQLKLMAYPNLNHATTLHWIVKKKSSKSWVTKINHVKSWDIVSQNGYGTLDQSIV